MLKINASVGKNGVNRSDDVRIVQTLLRRDYNYVWLAPDAPVSLTGKIDTAAVDAIIKFQKNAIKMQKPDGLIKPGLRTWKNLVRGVPKDSAPTPPDNVVKSLNRWRYEDCIQYMHGEMTTNINSNAAQAIYAANVASFITPASRLAALTAWAAMVRSNAAWDHKPKLRKRLNLTRKDSHFPIAGDNEYEWYYDIWSNIHYGYVGKAVGFTDFELKTGQNMGGIAGRDDPFDQETVQLGIDMWNSYGKEMSQTQIWQGLMSRRQKLLQIQQTDAYLKTIAENERHWWRHLLPIDNGE